MLILFELFLWLCISEMTSSNAYAIFFIIMVAPKSSPSPKMPHPFNFEIVAGS